MLRWRVVMFLEDRFSAWEAFFCDNYTLNPTRSPLKKRQGQRTIGFAGGIECQLGHVGRSYSPPVLRAPKKTLGMWHNLQGPKSKIGYPFSLPLKGLKRHKPQDLSNFGGWGLSEIRAWAAGVRRSSKHPYPSFSWGCTWKWKRALFD